MVADVKNVMEEPEEIDPDEIDPDITVEEIDLEALKKDLDKPDDAVTKPEAAADGDDLDNMERDVKPVVTDAKPDPQASPSAPPEVPTTPTRALAKTLSQSPVKIAEDTKEYFQSRRFAFVELSSLVLMFACIGEFETYSSGLLIYALIVSVFSLAACLGLQVMEFSKPGTFDLYERKVSLALLVWWLLGCWIITFRGPFTVSSNGFFGAWAGLIFTAKWTLNMDTAMFTTLPYDRKLLVLLGTCGLLEVFSCIKPLVQKTLVGRSAYGMVTGIITVLICGLLFKGHGKVKHIILKGTAGFLFLLWLFCAGLLTFGGPFVFTGNGYFATWGGFIASSMFWFEVLKMESANSAV